ncbi:MAG: hypothetical protein GX131_00105 [candidate division WS1 bacterium]|jgi:hypothetical protein|nr:hypothetical protein [candidate division WS1 bacterium]
MAHQILYDYIPRPGDYFTTFRVLWEPYTNRVSLRFRSGREAASGLVGTPEETVRYLDIRARAGAPWNSGAPREARERLVRLSDIARISSVSDQD